MWYMFRFTEPIVDNDKIGGIGSETQEEVFEAESDEVAVEMARKTLTEPPEQAAAHPELSSLRKRALTLYRAVRLPEDINR